MGASEDVAIGQTGCVILKEGSMAIWSAVRWIVGKMWVNVLSLGSKQLGEENGCRRVACNKIDRIKLRHFQLCILLSSIYAVYTVYCVLCLEY